MFQPFDNANQFYPGLILWCDPNCHDMDVSTLAPTELYDRKKARELRPCLVVAVNYNNQSFQPRDTQRWIRVDTAPPIAWRLSDAWIWVGTPSTLAMVFNNARIMHPHKDTQFSSNPIASSNLQNYWVHRQNYIRWSHTHGSGSSDFSNSDWILTSDLADNPVPGAMGSHLQNRTSHRSRANSMYSTTPNLYPPAQIVNSRSSAHGYSQVHDSGFNTLSPQPVVVPTGFTEGDANFPGWWRNPETGWFWHASRGLLPPSSRR
ncbi:hypothetical protein B0H19DRAFT_1058441 [Mycena capillaripes]|nr:hypothetical protein B0H19DRAFT_1058441 [Mycena capillaripes]